MLLNENMKEKKIGMHDVMQWLQEVGNDIVLQELEILVQARLIYLRYFDEPWNI